MLVGRVLIVDDRPVLAESAAEELQRNGLDAMACSPEQVLASLDAGVTHVLIPTKRAQMLAHELERCRARSAIIWTGAQEPPAGLGGTWLGGDCDVADLVTLITQGVAPRGAPVVVGVPRSRFARDEEVSREVALVRSLTSRESQILECLVGGAGGSAIARRLSISPHTVRTHVQNILTKLDVGSRAEAVAVARRAGMRVRPAAFQDGLQQDGIPA